MRSESITKICFSYFECLFIKFERLLEVSQNLNISNEDMLKLIIRTQILQTYEYFTNFYIT
jgi:hypothetical protein